MNKLAKIGMAGWTIFCFVGSCAGLMNVAQQTHGGQLNGPESLGAGIGIFLWLIIWAVPMVVLGIIALVTRPRVQAVSPALAQSANPTLCKHCGKYYAGAARFCPLCGQVQA
jgi:hypothetical protein